MSGTITALLIALIMLLPAAAQAAQDIGTYSIRQWGLVLGMSILGGLVNWFQKVMRGEVPATKISNLVGELCTSAFAGLLAFFICEWANFPQMLSAAMIGICGHMGTRSLTMFETWAERKFTSLSPPDNKP